VLLADDGRIKIGDFGWRARHPTNTATGRRLLGTIAYLSPSSSPARGRHSQRHLRGRHHDVRDAHRRAAFKGEQPMQIAYQHANDTVPVPSAKNRRFPRS